MCLLVTPENGLLQQCASPLAWAVVALPSLFWTYETTCSAGCGCALFVHRKKEAMDDTRHGLQYLVFTERNTQTIIDSPMVKTNNPNPPTIILCYGKGIKIANMACATDTRTFTRSGYFCSYTYGIYTECLKTSTVGFESVLLYSVARLCMCMSEFWWWWRC